MSSPALQATAPAPARGPLATGLLRFLAIALLASGFWRWAIVLGLDGGGGLEPMPVPLAVATGAFAVLDLVVAVGLWLLSAWAIVVWVAASLAEITLAFTHDAFQPDTALFARAGILAVAALFGLASLGGRRRRSVAL